MTPGLEKLLKEHTYDPNDTDPILVGKFFNPVGLGTWYVANYDPKTRICYGLVDLFEREWGDFSLDELEAVKLSYGLEIERDIHWVPKRFSEAII